MGRKRGSLRVSYQGPLLSLSKHTKRKKEQWENLSLWTLPSRGPGYVKSAGKFKVALRRQATMVIEDVCICPFKDHLQITSNRLLADPFSSFGSIHRSIQHPPHAYTMANRDLAGRYRDTCTLSGRNKGTKGHIQENTRFKPSEDQLGTEGRKSHRW